MNSTAEYVLLLFTIAVAILMIGGFISACVSWFQPRALFSLARWSEFVPTDTETVEGFYTRLYNELQSRLEQKQLPISAMGFGPRHMYSRRSIFGPRPVYLAFKYQHLTYYIYVAPAPNGLFVSSWLFSKHTHWEGHPVLKWLLIWKLYQMTLFQFDVLELFHTIAHGTLADVIDSYREEEGLQPLTAYERRPVLNSYYAKLKQGALPLTGYQSTAPVASPSTT